MIPGWWSVGWEFKSHKSLFDFKVFCHLINCLIQNRINSNVFTFPTLNGYYLLAEHVKQAIQYLQITPETLCITCHSKCHRSLHNTQNNILKLDLHHVTFLAQCNLSLKTFYGTRTTLITKSHRTATLFH